MKRDALPRNLAFVLSILNSAGWTVRVRSENAILSADLVWPEALRARYPTIPPALTDFVARVEACVKPDETAWFLTADDFAGRSDSAFAWNEWERMDVSRLAEQGDSEGALRVEAFWDSYLPFYLDVRSEYSYFAVRVTPPATTTRGGFSLWTRRRPSEPELGTVIHGCMDADLRDVTTIAASFDEFLGQLAATVQAPDASGPLSGFV
ncbi:MAG TPA: hypothetical protein VLN49_15450 [Gemmatimonadaceae bacterium]|nr:hypothetical protein [Gemmatimonadaceae bacterium]